MFDNTLALELLIMAASLLVLIVSSQVAIKNTVKASELAGIGTSRIGFTLVATSTSLPELAVAISSAISGTAAVSIGNILGSNVANVCLVAGLGLLLASLRRSSKVSVVIPALRPEELDLLYFGMFVASAIPIILISLLPASSLVGAVLIALFLYYVLKVVLRKGPQVPAPESRAQSNASGRRALINSVGLGMLGVLGVVLSADFLVDSTVSVALAIGVPASLIAATVVAVGTSLPELSLDVQAILKGEAGLAFGDIIGSCFTNITLILGVTLLLSPMRIDIKVFSDLVAFSILANIVLWYLMVKGRFGRMEGLYLLLLYSLFLASIMGVLTFV